MIVAIEVRLRNPGVEGIDTLAGLKRCTLMGHHDLSEQIGMGVHQRVAFGRIRRGARDQPEAVPWAPVLYCQ